MFQIVELEDVIRVPPAKFGQPLNEVALEILKTKYESTIDPELGYIILIRDVSVGHVGKIIPGDGSTYHKVKFSVLNFYPKIQEIVEGEIVEITDFGAFVRIGPVDAMLHLSQIIDDFLTSDVRQGIILASKSKRTIKVGSKVRVRITAVSLGRGATIGKIGVTSRQPFLGALEWIEEDLKKASKIVEVESKTKNVKSIG
ncbi:MAG: DNA-directed RNA polymerase [Candidatus Methylarchaceae archaeon HK02M2]|nr:DNA-directed RNA polymerase [Candidatus Methylarchaceae archaeon HK02M2]